MPDRAKYMILVLALYAVAMCVIVGLVAAIFDHPFLDIAVDLAPAIIVCLVPTIHHAMRHDLDS